MKISALELILCVILVAVVLTLVMNRKELLNVENGNNDNSNSNLTLQDVTNLSCDTSLDATLGTTLGAQAPFRSIDNPFMNGMYA